MDSTTGNLEYAFAGESQANRRYTFFAEKADEEGHRRAAHLFRAAAEAETVHARNHLRVLQGIKGTRENLEAAIKGEFEEYTDMYPGFIETARKEGNDRARDSFDLANKVEQVHHGLFQEALAELERGAAVKDEPFFVCQRCGNTVQGEAPDRCPICGAPKRMFKRVD